MFFSLPSFQPHALNQGELILLRGRMVMDFRVLRGRVWITWKNSPEDLFLAASQGARVEGDHILIEAEEDSLIECHALRPHLGERLRQGVQAVLARRDPRRPVRIDSPACLAKAG